MATLELPYEKVYDLLHKCCTSISPDVLYLMKRAAAKETNPEAKTFLETMLKNVELAGQMDKPVCQSPGFPSVWIRWGEAMQPNLTNLMGNITQSVIEATKAGYIRPSIVHPLTRHNPGDSSGRGVPNYELRYEKDLPYCEIIVSAKGCGERPPRRPSYGSYSEYHRNRCDCLRWLSDHQKSVSDGSLDDCRPGAVVLRRTA